VIAGLLQLVLPIGIGRFCTGHIGIAVAQLLLSFIGIGMVWAFIDGIVLLAGRPTDPSGRPLRS
jgi:TM2 domain-containing membrane protein YozV